MKIKNSNNYEGTLAASTRLLTIAILSLLSLVTLSGSILISSSVTADNDSVVDQISITVPVSCTMSGNGMNTHNAEIANGTYTPNIGTTTLHAFCNDSEGFAIYAAGYTGNEIGTTNSNKLVGTSASSNAVIDSGIATSAGNPDVSNWAMKLTITQDSGDTTISPFTIDSAPNTSGGVDASFSDYHTVPDEYVKVAHKDSNTDMDATTGGVKLTTTYAAYISKTQPADTYSGQVIYTLVHPATADAPVTIEQAYFQAGKQKLNGHYKMQDMNATICGSVNQYGEDGMAEVVDTRDNTIYHIAKLADDKCWMLDNLALDPTDSTTAQNMNATNTNATQEAITNLLNGGSTTPGWSSEAVANTNDFLHDGPAVPRINNVSRDVLVTSYGLASTNGQAKVGIYYNFCVASASTYCYEYGKNVDVPDTIMDASQDICPANWRMPTNTGYGGVGDYAVLTQKYSYTATETNSLQFNLSTPLSGRYSSSLSERGEWGAFWSSTYSSRMFMRYLSVSPTSASSSASSANQVGLSMRCLVSE